MTQWQSPKLFHMEQFGTLCLIPHAFTGFPKAMILLVHIFLPVGCNGLEV